MLSYLSLTAFGLAVAYLVHTYRCFTVNLAAAKRSGIPYIITPVYTFNRAWLVTHRLWMPLLHALPSSWTHPWIEYMVPDFIWSKLHQSYRDFDSDLFLVVSPGANTLNVADADAVAQITTRRNDFPKPTWMYASVDIFGKNVVSSEGMLWRHHRRITSPPFTEKNNHLVWMESLHQAQSMMAGWIGQDDQASGPVWDVAAQAMRLSLHVISRAGFGVRLQWPHEETETQIPEGHTLSYKDALSTLLENLIVVMLTPRLILAHSPLKLHRVANEAYVEWGKYMREMYQTKRAEVQQGESREGMDLMGALVKGAGITPESLNDSPAAAAAAAADPEKATGGGASPTPQQPHQLLTDDEILGNAFVFILAGHETAANTIHFALLFLAMHPASQRHLQRDLDAILGDRPPSTWDYDADYPRLAASMCGAVMNEQLRLIPPVVGIPKSTPPGSPQGLVLAEGGGGKGGKHVTVPEGCSITLNTAALHRNPRYWPHTSPEDLLAFRPERWLLEEGGGSGGGKPSEPAEQQQHASAPSLPDATDDDAAAAAAGGPDTRPDTSPALFRPPKGAYIPFSDGHRSCLGRRFAQVEILAVLAVVFKTWSVELDVGEFASDAELATAGPEPRRTAWERSRARCERLLREGMMTVITIQMRKGKVPVRFVRRGGERFDYAV